MDREGYRKGGGEAGAHRAPFAVVGFDEGLQICEWSGRAESLLGHPGAAALGRNVAELLPVAGGEASWRGLWTDSDDAAPVTLSHDDGRSFVWSPVPVRDPEGRVIGVACYGRDATPNAAERLQTEVEHAMLRALIDNLAIVACVYAPDGEYMMVEGKGLAAIGLKPGQLVGQNPFVLFGDNPGAVEFIRRGLAGVPTEATVIEEFDRFWETWHIPAPPGGRAALVSVSLDISESKRRERELLEKIDLVERQQRVIRELSTPIIEVWDGVLALPIIGLVDSMRTSEIMDSLLQSVVRMRARFAILDVTGVDVVDTATANHLLGMIRAVRLLGAEGIITGIHPGIAQTIVTLGVDLNDITVHASLRQALVYCLAGGRAKRGAAGGKPAA
jgi:rsbT co-antagonist protein RsbR